MKKIICLFLALVLSGCASKPAGNRLDAAPSAPPSGYGREAAEEVQVGGQIHQKILESFYPYTEPRAVNYINRIGYSLTAHAQRQELPYQFTILYNEKIYATSAPGGHIYVTTAMIGFLQNEAELAAVLGHEIGQLQRKDPRLSSTNKMLQRLTQTGAAIAPAFGQLGVLAMIGLAAIDHMSEPQSLTPDQRLEEADTLAMNYMTAAGYDPQGMIDMFYRFADAGREVQPYFFDYYQSRPLTRERARMLQENFRKLPTQGRSLEVKAREYQEMVRGIREIYKTQV